MRPGYIYFAETSSAYIKVGRFFEHLSVSEKESAYRRLDPEFKILHAYHSEDVVAEEKRVLSMLRLVGGTAVKGAGRECFLMSVPDAVAAAAAVSPKELEEVARKLIMRSELEGKSVKAWIDQAEEAQGGSGLSLVEAMNAYQSARMALERAGIFLSTEGESMGLSNSVFATVFDAKKLVKSLPALKSISVDVAGLALF